VRFAMRTMFLDLVLVGKASHVLILLSSCLGLLLVFPPPCKRVDVCAFWVCNICQSCCLEIYSAPVDLFRIFFCFALDDIHDALVVFSLELWQPSLYTLNLAFCQMEEFSNGDELFSFHVVQLFCVFKYWFRDAGYELNPVLGDVHDFTKR
jgi:hypothetical protein